MHAPGHTLTAFPARTHMLESSPGLGPVCQTAQGASAKQWGVFRAREDRMSADFFLCCLPIIHISTLWQGFMCIWFCLVTVYQTILSRVSNFQHQLVVYLTGSHDQPLCDTVSLHNLHACNGKSQRKVSWGASCASCASGAWHFHLRDNLLCHTEYSRVNSGFCKWICKVGVVA